PRLLRVFTLLAQTDIETLETQHAEAPHLRLMQKALAQEVTTRVHSAAAYEMAVAASEVLFGKGTLDTLRSMDEATFKGVFEGVPQSSVNRTDFETCPSVADLLSVATNHEIYPSKSEARRAIQGNGVSINKTKITDGNSKPNFELLLGRYLLVGKGKKNHLIEVQ
ncbi:MAG: tyrosine--tRNA ligase, partial [Runella slithyformis]